MTTKAYTRTNNLTKLAPGAIPDFLYAFVYTHHSETNYSKL